MPVVNTTSAVISPWAPKRSPRKTLPFSSTRYPVFPIRSTLSLGFRHCVASARSPFPRGSRPRRSGFSLVINSISYPIGRKQARRFFNSPLYTKPLPLWEGSSPFSPRGHRSPGGGPLPGRCSSTPHFLHFPEKAPGLSSFWKTPDALVCSWLRVYYAPAGKSRRFCMARPLFLHKSQGIPGFSIKSHGVARQASVHPGERAALGKNLLTNAARRV